MFTISMEAFMHIMPVLFKQIRPVDQIEAAYNKSANNKPIPTVYALVLNPI